MDRSAPSLGEPWEYRVGVLGLSLESASHQLCGPELVTFPLWALLSHLDTGYQSISC